MIRQTVSLQRVEEVSRLLGLGLEFQIRGSLITKGWSDYDIDIRTSEDISAKFVEFMRLLANECQLPVDVQIVRDGLMIGVAIYPPENWNSELAPMKWEYLRPVKVGLVRVS